MVGTSYSKKTPKNFAHEYQPFRVYAPGRTRALGSGCGTLEEAKQVIASEATALAKAESPACVTLVVVKLSAGRIVAAIGLENFDFGQ
jgi:hypothetical protein